MCYIYTTLQGQHLNLMKNYMLSRNNFVRVQSLRILVEQKIQYFSATLVAHYVTVRLAYCYTMLNPHLYNHRLTSCATRASFSLLVHNFTSRKKTSFIMEIIKSHTWSIFTDKIMTAVLQSIPKSGACGNCSMLHVAIVICGM